MLFDPGEGTQRQLIYAGLAASEIQRIFITHFHGDHCLGLAGIVQRLSLDRAPGPIHVYFPASGRVYFDRLVGASIYRRPVELVPHPIRGDGGVVDDDGPFVIESYPLDHKVDTYGYRVSERSGRRFDPEALAAAGISGPMVSQLQREGTLEVNGRQVRYEDVSRVRRGAVFSFVMDTRLCAGAHEVARGADMLVSESTYLSTERTLAQDYAHLTAAQAGSLAAEAGAQRLVLTHFSQRYEERGGSPFVAEARSEFESTVALDDLKRVTLPRP
jgi:ribonuclease Z